MTRIDVLRGRLSASPRPAPAPLAPQQALEAQAAAVAFLGKMVVAYVASVVLATLALLHFVSGFASDPRYHALYVGTWCVVLVNVGLLIAAIRGYRRFASMAVFFVGTATIVAYSAMIFTDANAHLLIIGILLAAYVFLQPEQDGARWAMGLCGLAAFLYVEFLVAPGSGLVTFDSDLNAKAETAVRMSVAAHISVDVALIQYRFVTSRRILRGVARHADVRAMTDELTGLYNRRPMVDRLEELARERRGGYAIALVDVDEFKTVNDRFGHEVGDEILKEVAEAMREHFRDADLVSRWGGDEFLVLLTGVRQEDLRALLERLRTAVGGISVPHLGAQVRTTVSIGAAMGAPGLAPDDVIAAADRALYAAKQEGRDRVEVLRDEERDDEGRDDVREPQPGG